MEFQHREAAAASPPTPSRRPRVTAVIPAKDEEKNIGWVLRRLPASVDEVVVVDGTSKDLTVQVARSVRPDVVVVDDRQPGKGCALRAGVAAARGEYVVMLDADGSMDPAEIDRFVRALDEGYDLAKGSRFLRDGGTADMTPLRDLGNKGLLLVSNLLYRRRHTDLCYGYAAFRREAFESLGLTATGFEIEAQLFLRATRHGLRVTEVPSFEAPRRYGNSNLNTFRDGWRVLKTILAERVRRVRRTPVAAQQPTVAQQPAAPGQPAAPRMLYTTRPVFAEMAPAPAPVDDGDRLDAPERLHGRTHLGRVPLGHNAPD